MPCFYCIFDERKDKRCEKLRDKVRNTVPTLRETCMIMRVHLTMIEKKKKMREIMGWSEEHRGHAYGDMYDHEGSLGDEGKEKK